MVVREIILPTGTDIAYKIFPGVDFHENLLSGQGESDWSALYGQFTVEHAISYLPNHYDRGHEYAQLVCISCASPVSAFILDDEEISDGTIPSSVKADILRRQLSNHHIDLSSPLLKSIGLSGRFVILLDSPGLYECAFPHSLINTSDFQFKQLATFQKKPSTILSINKETIRNAKKRMYVDPDEITRELCNYGMFPDISII